jgi:hypothetical protein
MKTHRTYILALTLCVALICGSPFHSAYGEEPSTDFAGIRFRCGKLSSGNICLSVLLDECSLRIVQGEGIPREADEKLIITRGDREFVVTSPSALHDCISISTKDEALEYLRFFSSLWMTHFFEQEHMEIFQSTEDQCGSGSCLPTRRWKSLDLKPVAVRKKSYGFEVRRNIVRPVPNALHVSAFQVTERVTADGEVSQVSEEAIELEMDDKARLSFFRYL